MDREMITGNDFKRMIAGAYSAFLLEYERINGLNVFPVPDGDTGTNMLRTLGAVAQAAAEAKEDGIGAVAKRAADSAIMGARGNSGVILSQLFRGIGRGLAGKREADSTELGKAFQYGVLYAYRSVARPVEGTILTVAKGIAKGAYHAVRRNAAIADILEEAIQAGERELARTPELLPQLKSAGVVDAGGKGLLVFLRGCLEGLGGDYVPTDITLEMRYRPEQARRLPAVEIARPYCTEFLVKDTQVGAAEVRRVLAALGDSLIVADGGELVKVHIHTAHPGLVLEQAVGWGTLHDIKIDNMADQHQRAAAEQPAGPRLKTAVVSVAAGGGLAALMREAGAAVTVAGGQSMNPSVEELMDALHSCEAERYILLPNNRNIALAAAQVKKLLGGRVEVIDTVSAPQGLAALLAYGEERSSAENIRRMNEAARAVREAAVTRAVRDSTVDGALVREGSYIGVVGGQVRRYGARLEEVLLETVRLLAEPGGELATLYYGKGLTQEDVNRCVEYVTQRLPELEIEVYEGAQPLYFFIVGVE